jgi:hypothetical protein
MGLAIFEFELMWRRILKSSTAVGLAMQFIFSVFLVDDMRFQAGVRSFVADIHTWISCTSSTI